MKLDCLNGMVMRWLIKNQNNIPFSSSTEHSSNVSRIVLISVPFDFFKVERIFGFLRFHFALMSFMISGLSKILPSSAFNYKYYKTLISIQCSHSPLY